MKSTAVLYLAILILTISLSIVSYNYFQAIKREKEHKALLIKSAYIIDSDNRYLHDDLWMILNSEYFAETRPDLPLKKKLFDSLENSTRTKDSISLVKNFIPEIRSKLAFHDSLYYMRSNWAIDGTPDYSYCMLYNFEHEPSYKLGDTVNFKFLLIEQLGYKSSSYEIVDFSPKNYGKQSGTSLRFSIPTKSLFKNLEKSIEYDFKFWYILRNNYTNKQDTSFHSQTFTVVP
ncbi:MAG: hypothetical protein QM737_18835 [Ferruginibacter sp.]